MTENAGGNRKHTRKKLVDLHQRKYCGQGPGHQRLCDVPFRGGGELGGPGRDVLVRYDPFNGRKPVYYKAVLERNNEKAKCI